jgi:hypothetical protein
MQSSQYGRPTTILGSRAISHDRHDLRGHSASDKPLENDRYARAVVGRRGAAVIAAGNLAIRLVGWSYSNR